jgi:DNA-binding protein H-NS
MAKKQNLASMSFDALMKLRDDVTAALSHQAEAMQSQLAALTGMGNGKKRGRPPSKKSSLKGRKVAAKYRSKKDPKLAWAGRGATPRCMRDEMKAGKLKKENFLIK